MRPRATNPRTSTLALLLLAGPALLGLLATERAGADSPFTPRWVSAGSTADLDRHREPYNFTLPSGKRAEDIVGIGIDDDNNHVYSWLRCQGMRSVVRTTSPVSAGHSLRRSPGRKIRSGGCAVETFGYMESDSRFVAMGAEYVAYAAILVFLFRFRARLYPASR